MLKLGVACYVIVWYYIGGSNTLDLEQAQWTRSIVSEAHSFSLKWIALLVLQHFLVASKKFICVPDFSCVSFLLIAYLHTEGLVPNQT